MKKTRNLRELVNDSKHIPSLPQILLRLIQACNDDAVPLEALSTLISKDPSLCTQVMRLVNSPFVGLGHKINTVDQAVVYLGTDTIKNLAISASVLQAFKRPEYGSLFALNPFWFHSFACAVTARKIAKRIAYHSPEEAFLAGLLHDIGKLILVLHYPDAFSESVDLPITPETYDSKVEQRIGISHSEAGAYVIRSWQLNSVMADAILYHHHSVAKIEEAFSLVKIVFAANAFFHASEHSSEKKGLDDGAALFGFSVAESEAILTAARQEAIDVAASFEIDTAPYVHPSPNPHTITGDMPDNDYTKRLISQVADITMMHGTLQQLLKADTVAAILGAAENGCQILFDIRIVCFFLYDSEKKILLGTRNGRDSTPSPVDGLAIKPNSHSIVARSFRDRQLVHTFEKEELTLIDEQLIRLFGQEGMMCFPIVVRNIVSGVAVMGGSQTEKDRLAPYKEKLALFFNQVALCLQIETEKEEKIRHMKSARLDAAAVTARSVIHEVNNPLGIIKNYVKILGLKLPEKHPAQDELNIISEEIDRVKLLMMNLSAFSKPQTGYRETLDINHLLGGFLALIDKALAEPSGIELSFHPDDTLPVIQSVKNIIKQAVLNILKNGIESLKKGGRIEVSTHCLNAGGKLHLESLSEDVDSIEIIIQDNGPGLPEIIKTHIFEPFYSTKKGEHSGLGLAIAHSGIAEIGGTLTWSSITGKGTRFSIILPVNQK